MEKRKRDYKSRFSTRSTWLAIRESHQECYWHKTTWFKHATPKFAFIFWLVMNGRLSTSDRMRSWNQNIDETCVLCQSSPETLMHLFFECAYSTRIWESLAKGVMSGQFSVDLEKIVWIASNGLNLSRIQIFTLRYIMQATVYSVWRERNQRRHEERSSPSEVLIKRPDKTMRNKFTVIRRRGYKDMEGGMIAWFESRLNN